MLLLSSLSLAELNGTINTTSTNSSGIVTGLYGSTYSEYCNTNSTCKSGDKCILDYDGTSSGSSQGWCVASNDTRCRNDNTYHANAAKICTDSNSKARTCLSGTWNTTTCNSTQTCSSGDCVASASSGGSTGGSSGGSTTPPPASNPSGITITALPNDFNITQGGSILKEITVKNTGNTTLPSVSLAISGIEWHNVTPGSVSISKGLSATFTVNFTIPENAEVKEYTVTATAQNGSALVGKSFKIRVLPSNKTVESSIVPLYNEYLSLISQLETNISDLANKGANVTDLRNILNSIKDKLNQTNSSLSSQDYFAANALLNEVKSLVNDLQAKIITTRPEEFKIDIIYIIIPIIIGVAAVLAYLFWPAKKQV